MRGIAKLIAVFSLILISFPAYSADEEDAEPVLPATLLAATNQGGLQKLEMMSMDACKKAADAIYEGDDDYSGPNLYVYCITADGEVWAFDRWNREE